jgi:hypothetical protein
MLRTAEVNELAARKRLLVMESELNRRALQHETARIQENLARWKENTLGAGRVAYPWLLAAAPVAGWFVTRKAGRVTGFISKALIGWRLIRRLKPLLSALRAKGPAEPNP